LCAPSAVSRVIAEDRLHLEEIPNCIRILTEFHRSDDCEKDLLSARFFYSTLLTEYANRIPKSSLAHEQLRIVPMRRVDTILTDLSPETVDSSVTKFVRLILIEQMSLKRDAAERICEEALSTPKLAPTFAKFVVGVRDKERFIIPSSNETITFRKIILGNLRTGLMTVNEATVANLTGEVYGDLDLFAPAGRQNETKSRMKQRRFSLIRFIGELYLVAFVKNKFLRECFTKLLESLILTSTKPLMN